MTTQQALVLCLFAIPLIWMAYYLTKIFYYVKRIYNQEIDDDHLFTMPDIPYKNPYFEKDVSGQRINDASKFCWVIRDIHRQVYLTNSCIDHLGQLFEEPKHSHDFTKAFRFMMKQECEIIIEKIKERDLKTFNDFKLPQYDERFFEIIKVY